MVNKMRLQAARCLNIMNQVNWYWLLTRANLSMRYIVHYRAQLTILYRFTRPFSQLYNGFQKYKYQMTKLGKI